MVTCSMMTHVRAGFRQQLVRYETDGITLEVQDCCT